MRGAGWGRRAAIIAALSVAMSPESALGKDEPTASTEAASPSDPRFTISGATRWRYESLSNQFRINLPAAGRFNGSDQAISGRTLIMAQADFGRVSFAGEIIDSRVYLNDSGSPISTSNVNTADILQAYATLDLGDALGLGGRTTLQLGRFTFTVGSRRFIARNGFRNTINAFTGVNFSHSRGDTTLTGLYAAPVQRKPFDRQSLLDNEQEFDEERSAQRFWGLHLEQSALIAGASGEIFGFGLTEGDSGEFPTSDREIYTVGARLFRAPADGAWDFDFEAAHQFGNRNLSIVPDAPAQDVHAQTAHAEVGYQFDRPWRPRLSLEYEYASGDDDFGDDTYRTYDPLFGLRRRDFGQTGIHGPLRRQNVSAAGARLTFQGPEGRLDGRILYKAAFLASDTDFWPNAGLIDVTGQSGDFIGHHLDTRLRFWLIKDTIQLETGGAILFKGEFARTAPNAPDDDDTLFGYVMGSWFF